MAKCLAASAYNFVFILYIHIIYTVYRFPSWSCKDWFDLGPNSATWSWPASLEPPDPFKPLRSPLRDLPSADRAGFVQPDAAHTYSIAGWGKDMCAGAIILLMYFKVFGLGSISSRLREGYSLFRTWCRENGKTSSITEFSFKTFKITSHLSYMSSKVLYWFMLYLYTKPYS